MLAIRSDRKIRRGRLIVLTAAVGAVAVGAAGAERWWRDVTGPVVVVAYNELGMHCMNQDFSELMILPPFNTLRAQVIRRGIEPEILTSGVTVRYAIPSSAESASKTNFWKYAQPLFGASFPPNWGWRGTG